MGLSEDLTFLYFIQTAAGIYFLHKNGFIHRDLKPENLLVDDAKHLKICDFGWAQKMELETNAEGYEYESERTTFCGTPAYMAPEMVSRGKSGHAKHGHSIDIWALGVLLYELLHGKEPFPGN